MNKNEQKIIIPGPCSADSERQTIAAATMVVSVITAICGNKAKIAVRSPMVKQPTLPSEWTGPGEKGLVWLLRICNESGVGVATEITSKQDALAVARQCNKLGAVGFVGWLGSKTGSGRHLTEWFKIIKDLPNLKVFVKNPAQEDPREWRGRVGWILEAGIPAADIHLVDRGYAPQGRENPKGHRNLLNFGLSNQIQLELKLGGTCLDPQHSGGTPDKALEILREDPLGNKRHAWMLEACPSPTLTDEKQRLNLSNFIKAIEIISVGLNHD